jgi:hypothetical protein
MNKTTKLSSYTAKEIANDFSFAIDAFGESSDRFLGTVTHKKTGEAFRVKIMKTGVVRETYSTPYSYCDPKLSPARASAVLALFPAFHA